MPQERGIQMARQSRKRLEQLVTQYPAIGPLRSFWAEKRLQFLGDDAIKSLPATAVRVQRPDPDMMHFQGREHLDVTKSWVTDSRYPGERGQEQQMLCAVDQNHNIIGPWLGWHARWTEPDTYNPRVVKDIFQFVDPNQVSYLLLATVLDWFEVIERPQNPLSGTLLEQLNRTRKREMEVIVYPKPKNMSWLELVELADRLKKEREEAYLYLPKERPPFPGIHQALREGCRMHAFLSGGGLRVVSLKKGVETIAYGEHPHIEEALTYLEEDFLAGGRPYSEVYGHDKLHPHYLTGSTLPTSKLDSWIRQGRTFDCWRMRKGGQIVFYLNGYQDYHVPNYLMNRAQRKPGVPFLWEDRGFTYKVVCGPYLPDGKFTHSISVVSSNRRKETDAFFFKITKTGRGGTFWDALMKAFVAPYEEEL